METSSSGLAAIKSHEGARLRAYLDSAGIPTIGYGHIRGVKMGDTITQAQADKWLVEDLKESEKFVNSLVKVPLNQNMFDALVSFTFNLGGGALRDSTLLKLLNQGLYKDAAKEFPKWNKARNPSTKQLEEVKGLTIRRAAEHKQFLTPV